MAGKKQVLAVLGTRPEAIKIAPLVLAAHAASRMMFRTLATGQQSLLCDEAFADFGLVPDLRLDRIAPHPDPDVAVRRLVAALGPRLAEERPDLVLVQGDTSSAYAGALAAHALSIPLAHVEAGLRSGDPENPWPEERNRVAIDALSALLFAPTETALARLRADPDVGGVPFLTGNTGIDALLWTRERASEQAREAHRALIFLTCHRRESFGAGIEGICRAALVLADRGDVRIVAPVHTNPAVRETVHGMLGAHSAISLTEPLSYRKTVRTMAAARLILTDSGGIQEEAPALGIPTLVLRDVTERQEGVASGNLRLVGTDPDRIVAEAARILDDQAAHAAMAHIAYPFGKGGASAKILDHIDEYFSGRHPAAASLPSAPFWRRDTAPKGA